jgi:hypothetical protein
MHGTFTFDKFKDNKGVTRRRNSTKNRQYNGQTKQYTENKRATESHKHPGMIFGGEKNVCHWTESNLIREIGKNW